MIFNERPKKGVRSREREKGGKKIRISLNKAPIIRLTRFTHVLCETYKLNNSLLKCRTYVRLQADIFSKSWNHEFNLVVPLSLHPFLAFFIQLCLLGALNILYIYILFLWTNLNCYHIHIIRVMPPSQTLYTFFLFLLLEKKTKQKKKHLFHFFLNNG